jgi:hypothetical protein
MISARRSGGLPASHSARRVASRSSILVTSRISSRLKPISSCSSRMCSSRAMSSSV